MSLLEVRNVSKSFDSLKAVDDCSFSVEEGTITALIGPNGAGKTTMFNIINGLHRADRGEIRFNGKNIEKLQPHQITRVGLSRTFQLSRQLSDLTVLENIVVQSPVRGVGGLIRSAILGPEREKAMALLEFVGIATLANLPAARLSYGQKKLMDIAAGMMADPKILLLDEPAGGINPALLDVIIDRIEKLRAQGVTIFIVEHNMDVVMSICDPVIVMAYGKVLASGSPAEVQKNDEVLDAYLGVG
ncbi:ABC transporter ATP-binding protein [Roseisalinus antarcticus]|uniref:Lipopolysaccharide export system ATP-binding protein LptB n=1 Tax=Roseisalinus antarcticus TaxID=254357 RepID=A0A1Y5U3Q9_9RHOB|nr:ABC transporter ATP-binding protein [Roseisalinus antarcticus]SLN77927.1 Lipopolysaccharide export system ATP-binding protein LptB [Roseisalinus antarcticus]